MEESIPVRLKKESKNTPNSQPERGIDAVSDCREYQVDPEQQDRLKSNLSKTLLIVAVKNIPGNSGTFETYRSEFFGCRDFAPHLTFLPGYAGLKPTH